MSSREVIALLKGVLRLFLVAVLLLSNLPAKGQYFEFSTKRKRASIPFTFVKNLLVIPIEINGKGPFNFILDSGVGIAVITDSSLVDSVGFQNVRSVAITGFGERKDISAYIAPSVDYAILPSIRGSITTAILKSDAFDLSSYTGMPIHGLIGYEFFSSFIVRINFSTRNIVIYPKETQYILKKGTKIPITIEEHKPYLTTDLVLETGEKIKVKLIIDTGAGHPLWLETIGGMPVKIPDKRIHANLGVGLAGKIDGYIGRISSLSLGKYTLEEVIASFPEYAHAGAKIRSFSRNGNIGNGVLRKFDIVFDYNRGALYLRPNNSFKERFDHDMSGIEFTSAGGNFKRIIVSRVEPGSAAEEAGIEENDEIMSINFKSAAEMSIDEIDGLFKSQDRRSFLLMIGRKGIDQPIRIILELKRRI